MPFAITLSLTGTIDACAPSNASGMCILFATSPASVISPMTLSAEFVRNRIRFVFAVALTSYVLVRRMVATTGLGDGFFVFF